MSRRLLFLSNGPRRVSVARLDSRFAALGFDVDIQWAYQGEFPDTLAPYTGIFLSGSPHGAYEDIPFIHREHGLIRDAAALGIPMLGICFGSQILASALCGPDQVFRRPSCVVGHKWLDVHPDAARDLVVFGLVDGNIHATGRIELRQSATVNGDILAARLSIEESASVRGRVELSGKALPPAESRD